MSGATICGRGSELITKPVLLTHERFTGHCKLHADNIVQCGETGVSQVASIFDGSCQIHWQDPQRKLATTAKSTNRIRSGSYRALPNSHRIRFRIRWRVAKFRQDPQTGSAQPLPNSTQDPQDRIRNHCQISTGSVKQDPQPLPNFRRIPLYRIRSCQMSGVSTVIESKPPIILVYSKIFVFARSRRLGRVQPLQVGAYTLSAKSVTKNVIFVLEHFLNEFFLLSQFFLRVQVYTFMIFLTRKNRTNILGYLWF